MLSCYIRLNVYSYYNIDDLILCMDPLASSDIVWRKFSNQIWESNFKYHVLSQKIYEYENTIFGSSYMVSVIKSLYQMPVKSQESYYRELKALSDKKKKLTSIEYFIERTNSFCRHAHRSFGCDANITKFLELIKEISTNVYIKIIRSNDEESNRFVDRLVESYNNITILDPEVMWFTYQQLYNEFVMTLTEAHYLYPLHEQLIELNNMWKTIPFIDVLNFSIGHN
jgi:hypothetical protein